MSSLLKQILCLALALFVTSSVALPIKRVLDGRRTKERRNVHSSLYSLSTGRFVHLFPDGNITGTWAQGAGQGKFFVRHGSASADGMLRHNLSLTSLDHNGSYLHFVQLVPVAEVPREDNNGTSNDTEHLRDSVNETAVPVEVVEAAPQLMLVLDDIDGEDEAGMIRHHMWTEENILGQGFYRFYVTLADGKVCYLAFENDGTAVENPCLSHEELQNKALFVLYPVGKR